MADEAQREMSLDEWCERLHPQHKAREELSTMKDALAMGSRSIQTLSDTANQLRADLARVNEEAIEAYRLLELERAKDGDTWKERAMGVQADLTRVTERANEAAEAQRLAYVSLDREKSKTRNVEEQAGSLASSNFALRAELTASRAEAARWQTVTGFSEPELCQVHIRNVEGLEEAARSETVRLRERVEKVIQLWADFSSQEMYGETFSDGMEEQDYEAWCEALQALTSDPEPTT